ncbi:phycobilisome linker polypeptide/CpcD/allophycocyanin linker domain protein [Rubidibacter lacunae KORDI 51-2]|uniref:Phycobilisome linker polypeptide/CpcD/allophycocyanin linker domain protein n=1 Tax=Rubidibacter lacunae KORDI 51-2 TaxID=582515 RepID=U5DM32_9CHRO|nr:phycobilisome rod-core linker polypeptide [Rubidibacter lacunae]ERN41947.1 phycobilisome linker polypeptide/CpcD/allophycocyanin linker domain protein [Rubidibacter lacunae KORDI 51-2]
MISTAPAVKFGIDAFAGPPVEFRSPEDGALVIRAVYRQVLGNAHVMDSERLASAESMLCDGSISVRGFVQCVANSELYRERFFNTASPYRFVELNFKHLLGRAPLDQAEISEHIRLYNEQGYEAEIASYIFSDEYQDAFGENVVPYYKGIRSQVGQKQVGYNRMFALFRGPAESSTPIKDAKLYSVATNSTNSIVPPRSGERSSGAADATGKRFKIVVAGQTAGGRRRLANTTYIVAGDNMTSQIQRINRTSGRIVSIEEIN